METDCTSIIQTPTFCIQVKHRSGLFESFHIHKLLLTNSSPYFAALIDSEFVEGTTNTVTLSEDVDDPEAINAIVEYLYFGNYKICYGKETEVGWSMYWVLHTKIFLMACRLCMSEVAALALNRLSICMEKSEYIVGGLWFMKNLAFVVDRVYSFTPSPEDYGLDEKGGSPGSTLFASTEDVKEIFSDSTTNLSSSSNELSNTSSGPKKPNHAKVIRSLVAGFCAWKIESIRDEPKFKHMTRKHPEFTDDLLSAIRKGGPVREIPLKDLQNV